MLAAGLRIDNYELLRAIGRGGFGVVFVARDHQLGRECALKFLLPEHSARTDILERFLLEARAAARIGHPGIVTVFECGVFRDTGTAGDGMAYIAMELLEGETLAARLERTGALPEATAAGIARQIAAALGAAHAEGIVHRDLKPDNIFLVPDPSTVGGERVKVLDFGIAKLAEQPGGGGGGGATGASTATYAVFGTPRYMSPEQCKSSTHVDARSDIYALGCIMFELACGGAPFAGESGEQLAHHQLTSPPTVRSRHPEVSEVYDSTVAAMLAKQPDHRPPSMEAVVRLLDRQTSASGANPTVASLVPPAPDLAHAATAPPPKPAPKRWWILGGAFVLIAVAIVVVVALGGSRKSEVGSRSLPDSEKKCRAMADGEQWAELADCAEDLRAHAMPVVADELAAMAKRELPAMAAMRDLTDLLARFPSNVDELNGALARIDAQSRYVKPARTQIKNYVREWADSLARYHQCSALALLRDAAKVLPADALETVLRVNCAPRGPITLDCKADAIPEGVAKALATSTWSTAEDQLLEAIDCRTDHGDAPPSEWYLAAVTSACHLRAHAIAHLFIGSLGDNDRTTAIAACKDAGIPL